MRSFSAPSELCSLQDPALNESSGVAASRTSPDLVFSHNDSGGGPFVFAIKPSTCETVGTYRLNVANFDWEEITSATLPNGQAVLLVGDIGDNYAFRDSVEVHAIAEPTVDAVLDEKQVDVLQTFELRYPNGASDAECMLFDPATGSFAIVTKSLTGGARLLVAPDGLSQSTIDMTDAGQVVLPSEIAGKTKDRLLAVTGCSVSPDGQAMMVRTPDAAWEYKLGSGDFAAALSGAGVEVDVPNTIQGESVTYSIDGASLYWTTEGKNAPVFRSTGGVVRQQASILTTTAASDEASPTIGQTGAGGTEVRGESDSALSDPSIVALLGLMLGIVLLAIVALRVRVLVGRAKRRRSEGDR